jgi:hypothetical protein
MYDWVVILLFRQKIYIGHIIAKLLIVNNI